MNRLTVFVASSLMLGSWCSLAKPPVPAEPAPAAGTEELYYLQPAKCWVEAPPEEIVALLAPFTR